MTCSKAYLYQTHSSDSFLTFCFTTPYYSRCVLTLVYYILIYTFSFLFFLFFIFTYRHSFTINKVLLWHVQHCHSCVGFWFMCSLAETIERLYLLLIKLYTRLTPPKLIRIYSYILIKILVRVLVIWNIYIK